MLLLVFVLVLEIKKAIVHNAQNPLCRCNSCLLGQRKLSFCDGKGLDLGRISVFLAHAGLDIT